jgi:hypothetical protein
MIAEVVLQFELNGSVWLQEKKNGG